MVYRDAEETRNERIPGRTSRIVARQRFVDTYTRVSESKWHGLNVRASAYDTLTLFDNAGDICR